MESRVVLVARLRSSLGVAGTHDGLTVADVRHPDAVETTLAQVHRDGVLPVVTCGLEDLEEVRRLVTFATVRYPGLRACLEPLPGSSMAVGVLSSLVDDITAEDDALAWRLSALDLLRTSSWSGTWLPRLSGLRRPAPSLWQQARSWLPGSGFVAVDEPENRVVGARRPPFSKLTPRPGSALLHSPVQGDAWMVEAVKTALQAESTSAVTTIREQVDVYGTDRAVEMVAVPTSFHADSRPDPASVHECEACGLHHARAACPSCKMSADGRPSPSEPVLAAQGDTP